MVISPRECDVLNLIACGYTDSEIARKLQLSENTIGTYMTRILLKLNSRTRAQAAVKFLKKNPKWKIGERYISQ